MNFIEILKKAFMDNWTGGASGEPNRYHGRGAFDDFEPRDMLRQNRWITEESGRNPKSDKPEYTSYYHPRPTGESMRSYIEDQRDPYASDPGLQRGFQDWPGVNPQGRMYNINPDPEGRNPDGPAHRYHPGASGVYNPAAGQAALANRRPPAWLEQYDPNRVEEVFRNRRPPGLSDNTTRTIVQDKDGTKETVVTKTPNPATSMMEIMKKIRELSEARAR